MTAVLDSWAILRYLEDSEPSAEQVADLLAAAKPLMSWINLGEVHYVLRRTHGEKAAFATVRDLQTEVDVVLPDHHLVLDAARIKADHPMSYADAFAAALAMKHGFEVWTGDPELLVDDAPWRWRDLR